VNHLTTTWAKPRLMGILLFLTTLGWGTAARSADTEKLPEDISTLAAGTYFASGTMHAHSYRVVAKEDGRVCVKVADGLPNPYEGYQSITISTISARPNNQFVVAATDEPFIVSGPKEFVIGSRRLGVWQLSETFKRDWSEGLTACITAPGKYVKTFRGLLVAGLIEPHAPGRLIAEQADAKINVRKKPGVQAEILHYGVPSDRVTLINSSYDAAGAIWYEAKFPDSGAQGWVRGDFVQRLTPPFNNELPLLR
jgi:hypothetical protein